MRSLTSPPAIVYAGPVHAVLDRFIEPRVTLGSEVERRHARLTALNALVLALLTLPATVAGMFSPKPLSTLFAVAIPPFGLVYLAAYMLSRRGSHLRGAQLTIGVQVIGTTAVWLLVGERGPMALMAVAGWLVLPLLTAAALLELRGIAWTVVSVVAAVIVGSILSGMLPTQAAQSVIMLTTLGSVTLVVAWHRRAIGVANREELERRNAELEILRCSLEERVAERTAALAQSHTQLEQAYSSLQENHQMLIQTEKLAAVGRLTAGIAHEMSSPLATVRAAARDLCDLVSEYRGSIGDASVGPSDHLEIANEMAESCTLMNTAAERAAAFVAGVKAQTRNAAPGSRQIFNVEDVVRQALPLLAHAARAARCSVDLDVRDEALLVFGTPERLSQVVVNLVGNAIDAAADGHVWVRLLRRSERVVLEVEDDGCGIDAHAVDRIFEPLFTTKPYGKGTGLGLSIVKEIVEEELNGSIEVSSAPGSGSTFRVLMPVGERN